MKRYLLDTSCLVAAVCSWHEHHERTAAEIERRRRAREGVILAGTSLIEGYAVLTRLPPPHRLAEEHALTLLEANWGQAEILTLSPTEHWRVLRRCRDDGVAGGQTYDAVIAACARKGGARTLLTWNVPHFARFADEDLAVASPDGR